ncbi:MAG: phytanoyl-CoA dioxygenase family protein [Saprospiraceae bacterium]|nr:phytanoyl-CoA dioxygenase family protein [Saprospiraceae bacterium]
MSKLQRIFQRYTGVLRSLKATYFLHNLLNAKRLKHNRALYKRYGLNKSIFSPIGAADFKKAPQPDEIPWLDRPDRKEKLTSNATFQGLTPEMQQKIRQFEHEGYLVLENFFSQADTDHLNQTVEELLQNGKAGYNFTGRKIFNLWEISPFARDQFFKNPELNQLLSFLLGRKVVPFQSLNFTLGSEQRAHSDAIHMTTQPQGYLIAAWIALEDVHEGCGPLIYYPGSHRLPFVSTQDYNSGNGRFTLGHESNKHYEDKIEEIIQQKGLEKKVFLPKRGDVLVWHSNLIHGGSPITTPGATRKSMVCHYYAEGVICYHEMSQRPALLS